MNNATETYVPVSVEYNGVVMPKQVHVASELYRALIEDKAFLSGKQREALKNGTINFESLDALLLRGKFIKGKTELKLNAMPYLVVEDKKPPKILFLAEIPNGLNRESGIYRNEPDFLQGRA